MITRRMRLEAAMRLARSDGRGEFKAEKLAQQLADLDRADAAKAAKKALQPTKERKYMKRGKGLGPGAKKLARDEATAYAIALHFSRQPDGLGAPCQYCGRTMLRGFDDEGNPTAGAAVAHHKTPRSELRKAGVEDLDAPHRLLIVHRWGCHPRIHGGHGKVGRPKDEAALLEFKYVETHPANAANGIIIRSAP